MKYLNLGCGQRFHSAWTNIDFVSCGEGVIAHNLLNGIPFPDNEFDFVYHSHVLEHFEKEDGLFFIKECYRVLKHGGIIRIAVPDLEQIVKKYLISMEDALAGDSESAHNYEWMMLEMYDQTVRNQSGGNMAKYFYKDEIPNERFVFSRVGQEGIQIREKFLKSKSKSEKSEYVFKKESILKRMFNPNLYLLKLKKIFLNNEIKRINEQMHYTELGKFRLSGEIHQWMYDRYSLNKVLKECGFSDVKVLAAFDSVIPEWNSYELDSKDGTVFKPDSLFVEAIKK